MPTPFPGMDPFIESCGLWEDFHHELITEIKTQIAARLPPQYVARAGERYYILLATEGELDPQKKLAVPDVGITGEASKHSEAPTATLSPTTTAVADEEAVAMRGLVEAEFRESFLEIYAIDNKKRLVTTIEVLSPSNKHSGTLGWNQYVRKRQAHLAGHANLVEIDLLRAGSRMPMESAWPSSPYYTLTCWKQTAPDCKVWPGYVNRPLPHLRVPLDPPDEDLTLNLQWMVDAIYERSRYAADIDYRKPCQPPLDEESKRWLAERLEG